MASRASATRVVSTVPSPLAAVIGRTSWVSVSETLFSRSDMGSLSALAGPFGGEQSSRSIAGLDCFRRGLLQRASRGESDGAGQRAVRLMVPSDGMGVKVTVEHPQNDRVVPAELVDQVIEADALVDREHEAGVAV